MYFFQRVHNEYRGWSKDTTSLILHFNSSSTIELDQGEEEVDPWKILPLVSPPHVRIMMHEC